jgi:hypothetical protein
VAALSALCLVAAGVVAASALGILTGSSEGSSGSGGWDSVEAFERTPVETEAPPALLWAARRMADVTSGEHQIALGSLRKLRSGLGREPVSIYALRRADGLPCMIVWRQASNCVAEVTNAAHPGVLWMVTGGYPAWARTDGLPIPSALVGLVADDIRAVTFVENGTERSLGVVNNTFFAELADPDAKTSWNELRIEYKSGMTRTARVPTP